jgi:hypothetical protein
MRNLPFFKRFKEQCIMFLILAKLAELFWMPS